MYILRMYDEIENGWTFKTFQQKQSLLTVDSDTWSWHGYGLGRGISIVHQIRARPKDESSLIFNRNDRFVAEFWSMRRKKNIDLRREGQVGCFGSWGICKTDRWRGGVTFHAEHGVKQYIWIHHVFAACGRPIE